VLDPVASQQEGPYLHAFERGEKRLPMILTGTKLALELQARPEGRRQGAQDLAICRLERAGSPGTTQASNAGDRLEILGNALHGIN
jgi:hypothetical protein